MAGQQHLLNFLQQPAPGKAQDTALLSPALGQKPTPRHAQAQQQIRQAQADQRVAAGAKRAAERHQMAQERINLRRTQEVRLQGDRAVRAQQKAQVGEQRAVEEGASLTATLGDQVFSIGDRINTWADSVATPGGIGLLLLLIFLLLWAVVPVNGGKTRLQLLWLTFTGRTKMAASPDAGGTFNATETVTTAGSGGIGSGKSNGHNPTAVSDLLASLPIRDFGYNV